MGSKSAIGIGNGICFKQVRDKGGGSYIDPLVRDSIVGLWKFDQNTNESPTRNIIKNTIKGKGGDLELLNFAYKANSGYNGYPEDFTSWISSTYNVEVSKGGNKAKTTNINSALQYTYSNINRDVESFKVKISNFTKGTIYYYYRQEDGKETTLMLGATTVANSNGIIELPKSYNTVENGTGVRGGFNILNTDIGVTIEQLPLYEGALVTDGKDDMIVSQKTVQEMLGGSSEITVVSMIHQIESYNSNISYTNYIRNDNGWIRNNVINAGKTGIYGYSCKNNATNINNILGDKNDYATEGSLLGIDSVFSVVGRSDSMYLSKVAHYWTIIAKIALTTDQINQVISYFNLDKHVKPDIIYDTIRQGITNENHASFNDELVDFSGNGHNMKIYNSAWNKESGINDEGAWQTDGVSDYGNVENLPILKDYTVAIERRWITSPVDKNQCLAFKGHTNDWGAFACEFSNAGQLRSYTFSPVYNILQSYNEKSLVYQSKYSYSGTPIDAKATIDGSTLRLCLPRGNFPLYANVAIKMFLLFPYSLSEFLLERQLKKYKLGTLYPNMVEFRPIIKSNVEYSEVGYLNYTHNLAAIKSGDYVNIGDTIAARIVLNNTLDEIVNAKVNGQECEVVNVSPRVFDCKFIITSKSPQKIDITIDEYIRFEDIVQPYPAIVNIPKVDGGYYTYGEKIPVGYKFNREGLTNLLRELYSITGFWLNDVEVKPGEEITVSKIMVCRTNATWKLNTTEPHAIYSLQKLNIPNSSLKILGYVPDLTGKGNHGKLNNFAYTEDSGVAADGSIKFDGTDDYITIPTLAHGGKCMMMKVNWNKDGLMLYDQRKDNNPYAFAIYIPIFNNENSIAYSSRNDGKTYIDGVLNTFVKGSQLKDVTHNITITNSNSNNDNTVSPAIGSNAKYNTFYAQMSLYEFMLFPEIPSEDEIKKLNDVMGIEGGYVESPNYYWDAYGKKNTDTDRNLIADQVSKDIANALEVKNVGYNSESGYGGINNKKKFPNTDGTMVDSGWATDLTRVTFDKINDYKVRITNVTHSKALFWYGPLQTKAFYKITGVSSEKPILFGHDGNNIILVTADTDGIYEVDWSKNMSGTTYVSSCIMAGFIGDCNITIEQVAQYPNGLLSDGVEDHLINTAMPILTDYTWIVKRKWLDLVTYQTFVHKGAGINSNAAFLFEYIENGFYTRSFSNIGESKEFPELISYQTKNNYNGTSLTPRSISDGNQLRIFMGNDQYPRYTKAVFYKAMLYDKTIDQLSINMLKNLFERDELIDVTNPIFKKEEL